MPGKALLCISAFLLGCDSLLNVDNPNNVVAEDIRNDGAAASVANGALYTLQNGWDDMLGPYAVVSDELHSIGTGATAEGFSSMDLGTPDDPANEVLAAGVPYLAQARWMADEAIEILDSLDSAGELTDPTHLARSYVYGALAYVTIANWMDDFTMSDRAEAAPPIEPDNMHMLYGTAIEYLTAGLEIGQGGELGRNLLAVRARARHGLGVWNMIGRIPITVTNGGLVSDAAAAQDALDALAQDPSDWRFAFEYEATTQLANIGLSVNLWNELRFGDDYVNPTADDRVAESIALLDPVDAIPDPRLEQFILEEFQPSGYYPTLTVFSAREMHLIIAENALVNDDLTMFADEINVVRSLDGLSDWTAASSISAREMLIHERRVNLFLQGHRLNDMYRFGIKSRYWEDTRPAYTTPGTFFCIPISVIETNCHLNPDAECPR
jgi:hypothetical protein